MGFERPLWLLALMVLPVLVGLSWRTLAALGPRQRAMALAARCVVWTLLVMALAGAVQVVSSDDLAVIFLADRSRSIPEELQEQQEAYLRRATAKMDGRREKVGVISFDRSSYLEQLPQGAYVLPGISPTADPDHTDLSKAIRLALASFPSQMARRMVLLSDGNETLGQVMEEVQIAAANEVVIDVVPMLYEHSSEVWFDRIVAPSQARRGDEVPLRLVLHTESSASGTLLLRHNDRLVRLTDQAGARLKLRPGINVQYVAVQVTGTGPQRWEAEFIPDTAQDTILLNNKASAFTLVEGKGRILLVTTDRNVDSDRLFVQALRGENIDIDDPRLIGQARLDPLELQGYSAVILSNVPADMVSREQQEALSVYVRDMGGGLVMLGGDESFGAGGWIGSPVEQVMPLRFDIKQEKRLPRGALVLIMHTCEAPRGNFYAEQVAIASVKTLSRLDYIGMLAFSYPDGDFWAVPLQQASNKTGVIRLIRRASRKIGDMPSFEPTMELAYRGLMASDAAQKHIIIISDGDPSPPSRGLLRKLRAAKITCSTVGIGFGYHVTERSLRNIAALTKGRYYACQDPAELPQIFVKETRLICRPLIHESPFKPALVSATSPVVAGLTDEEIPPLAGLVLTTPKPLIEMPLVRATKGGIQDPVLAHWQCGLGKAVAFTSGMWRKWGPQWAGWEKFGKLWAQVMRWCMRQSGAANFEVTTRLEGNQGKVIIEAMDKDTGFLNFLQVRGILTRPDLAAEPLNLVQTGPGLYEGTFEVTQPGQHLVHLAYQAPAGDAGTIGTGLTLSYSPEYRTLSANRALLRQIAEATGGKLRTVGVEDQAVLAHDLPAVVSTRPIWERLLWWALFLFLLDVAVRRVSVNWRAVAVRARVTLAELAGRKRVAAESAEALAQLKQVHAKLREDLRQAQADQPRPDRETRFDAGDQAAARPSGELDTVLGGARSAAPQPAPSVEQPDVPASHTERLLAAKRKAQQQAEQGEGPPPQTNEP